VLLLGLHPEQGDAPAGRRGGRNDAGQAAGLKSLGAELIRGHGRLDGHRRVAVETPDGTLTALGSTVVGNNPASHPLYEGVSAGQNYLYVLANGLSQIVGYRVGPGGSLTQVTTASVAAGSGGIGAS
jgi:hypothetical protein